MAPGEHEIETQSHGGSPVKRRVTLIAGQRRQVVVR